MEGHAKMNLVAINSTVPQHHFVRIQIPDTWPLRITRVALLVAAMVAFATDRLSINRSVATVQRIATFGWALSVLQMNWGRHRPQTTASARIRS